MIVKSEDIEYILNDFLEVRYGTNELENARIVRFLSEHIRDMDGVRLDPIAGFTLGKMLVVVTSEGDVMPPEACLLLNSDSREKSFHRYAAGEERLAW